MWQPHHQPPPPDTHSSALRLYIGEIPPSTCHCYTVIGPGQKISQLQHRLSESSAIADSHRGFRDRTIAPAEIGV